ncbi:MAG: hypothetical protein NTU44_02510 [Bacteroidetes bacterium]|nr:hypothetical protein [Bacteroidota bacterium]
MNKTKTLILLLLSFTLVNQHVCGRNTIDEDTTLYFTMSPANVMVADGGSVIFQVTTNIPANYQWQVSVDCGATWTDITNDANYSGASTNQLVVTQVDTNMTCVCYRCKAFDNNYWQVVFSSPGCVTILPNTPPTFHTDSVYCNGSDSAGRQLYHYSFQVNNSSNITANIISFTSPDGTITGISTIYLSPGITIISGNLFLGQSSLAKYGFFRFLVDIVYPPSAYSFHQVLYIPVPNCSGNVCDSNLLQNGTFKSGNIPGPLSVTGHVNHWNTANGNPLVYNGEGCDDSGYVRLAGNNVSGDAIRQSLDPGSKIEKGKWYSVSMCLRVDSLISPIPNLKIRVMAFNGTLPAGPHAPPSVNTTIIGFTGLINSSEGWTTVETDHWYAYKDFDNISLNIFNNDLILNSIGYIDNICLHRVADTCDCDGFERDSLGNVIIPDELLALLDDQPNSESTDSVEMDLGLLKDMYGDAYNETGTFYDHSPDLCCLSLGGTMPTDNSNMQDSLAAYGVSISADSIRNLLGRYGDSLAASDSIHFPMFEDKFSVLSAYADMRFDSICFCDTTSSGPPDPNSPFQGMDIVFVHGFMTDDIVQKILYPNSYQAKTKWPEDKPEFYKYYKSNTIDGEWKIWADNYWYPHIQHFLENKGYKNRYLIVAWATTQRIPFAAHAILTQIYDAMTSEDGVMLLDTGDSRHKSGFGKNGLVIISHSTGALVTNIAMAAANSTKTNPAMRAILGPAYQISDKVKLHVSLHGAISGSNYATLALLVATPALSGLAALVWHPFKLSTNQLAAASLAASTSVLVDLVPQMSQILWMNPISFGQLNPVPTLTVAGGSPGSLHIENCFITKGILFPGFDDGVLTIECQTGNPLPASLALINLPCTAPGAYLPSIHLKAIDMGVGFFRSLSNFRAQFKEGSQFGFVLNAGCTPFLSPTGMVQPYESDWPVKNPLYRYHNHYSFLQSTSDHFSGPTGQSTNVPHPGTIYLKPHDEVLENDPYTSNNYEPSYGEQNYEEESVITDGSVYTNNYVSPSFSDLMYRVVKGPHKTIKFRIPFCKKCKTHSKTFWIWKRNYDRLTGFGSMMECDYVYKYVLKP